MFILYANYTTFKTYNVNDSSSWIWKAGNPWTLYPKQRNHSGTCSLFILVEYTLK